ncbi:hypothetical protein SASPL_115456 [Salvia splendens]|uniref:Isopenicillin N synthase-like Fe(2+) 2OG dioxygenase domain-containing protein n=1 Tax=Salvia splendens TaxID=180675 RepID=A0A8X8Y375_SALSN|nr:hypothetical protein SASPL_115456 [Salvia splendens]
MESLQIEHDGKWFNVDSPKNSIYVNVADQLEIFINEGCKSLKHRAVLNEERDRISIVLAEKDGGPKFYAMKYEEYMESQLTKSCIDGKSRLEKQMILAAN